MVSKQNSFNQAAPQGLIKGWFTPRAEERDLAFRERTIRVMVLLVAALLLAAIAAVLVSPTNTPANAIIWGILLIVPAAAAIAVNRGKITLAGMILTSLFVLAIVITATRNGFWGQTVLFVVMIAIPLAAVLLPRRLALGYIILMSLLHVIMVIYQTSQGINPTTLTTNTAASPPASIILITTGFVVVTALGGYLLHEFDSRLSDLLALVANLEQRVADRTKELEVAKNQAEVAQAAAEEANEVKSRFLANMSHELRTPLNAILNFTAFVADGVMGPVNAEQADILNQAISSGKHLLSLINDVLDITKIESGMMDLFVQDVDINAALATTISVAKGLVKDKSLDLITDVQEDLPVTYGDRRRMRQVFLNLISNAIKFTNKGHVSIKAHRHDAGIQVVVEDTGIGIAEEDHHLVFESFRQVQKHDIEAVGTGLGLPISKHFVEVHGGKMWFESAAGKGTTFYVYLPTLSEAEAEALSKSAISMSE